MNRDINNIRHKRPLSPHLGIYKPQITSVLSILHRITGIGLYFGMLLFCWWLVSVTYSNQNADYIMWPIFNTLVWKIFLLGWSFALFYHMLNGVRHLFWDAGFGFSLSATHISGWCVILGSIVLTAIAWGLVYLF
jgi:succinate dehydrogenase / fumarate reductase cytochrome b subunit